MAVMFIAYICLGLLALTSNLLFLIAISRSSELISRYRIILAQISAAVCLALATLVAGIARTIITSMNITTMRSRSYCMLMPWNILFIWSEPMTAISELVVSVDRLLLISFPVAYCKAATRFQLLQIALSHIPIGLAVIASWIASSKDNNELCSPLCWTSLSMVPFYQQFFALIRVCAALLSVILYFIAFVLSRKYLRRIAFAKTNETAASLQAFQRRQSRLTATMGISCVFALLLYVIPTCLLFASSASLTVDLNDTVTVLSVLTTNFNPLPNLAILYWRQADIARAVKEMLTCACFSSKTVTVVSTQPMRVAPMPSKKSTSLPQTSRF